MSFGDEKIAEILKNASAVQALLSTFSVGSSSYPAIFNDLVCPDSFKGTKYITWYRNAPVNGALEYNDNRYTINCRGPRKNKSQAKGIQEAVFTAFNRKNPITGRGLFLCSVLPIIPPANERDDYNAPIEVRLKTNL